MVNNNRQAKNWKGYLEGLLTLYNFSSNTRIGPVTPMIMRGCPESSANTTPHIEVPRIISEMPIQLSVFSPTMKQNKSIRLNKKIYISKLVTDWKT